MTSDDDINEAIADCVRRYGAGTVTHVLIPIDEYNDLLCEASKAVGYKVTCFDSMRFNSVDGMVTIMPYGGNEPIYAMRMPTSGGKGS